MNKFLVGILIIAVLLVGTYFLFFNKTTESSEQELPEQNQTSQENVLNLLLNYIPSESKIVSPITSFNELPEEFTFSLPENKERVFEDNKIEYTSTKYYKNYDIYVQIFDVPADLKDLVNDEILKKEWGIYTLNVQYIDNNKIVEFHLGTKTSGRTWFCGDKWIVIFSTYPGSDVFVEELARAYLNKYPSSL